MISISYFFAISRHYFPLEYSFRFRDAAHDASRVESGPLFVFIVWHVHAIQSDMLYLFALFMQANGNLTPTILIQRDQSQSKQPLEFVG